ncbi:MULTISPECIES: hypothetical protein [unclassified Sphingobacterium]|uniref:hypothetical protein n=1 Tax=Sphingobacterium TaxID=28453 RepID=UPI0025EC639B|nr:MULTISPECIES: hypothetical protein [unclassified Sphingobacterium]
MDIKKIAKECLEFNKEFEQVHVTSDGTPFLNLSAAKYHGSKQNDTKVSTFDRDEIFDKPGQQKAADVITSISTAETIEDLESILPEGEDRKSVLKAYEAKKQELEKEDQ